MPFTRQPPPSPKSSRTSYPPLPLDHTPSSSSSIPSLTSEGSSSSESEALASPLGQLSLGEEIDSPPQTRKPQVDPAIQLHDREMVADGFGSTMRENKVEQESRRDQRSIHSDVDTNVGQEGSSLPLSFPPSPSARPFLPTSPTVRPSLPHRNSSYSKRHASFDTPREVPLPYMPHSQSSYSASTSARDDSEPASRLSRLSCVASDILSDTSMPVFDDTATSSSSDSTPSSSSSLSTSMSIGGETKTRRGSVPDSMDLIESSATSAHFTSSYSVQYPRPQSPRMPSSSSGTVPLFSRPLSSPGASRPIHSPRPTRPPGVPDRGSTASLPLPADTPYHALPAFAGGAIQEDQEMRSAAPTRPSSSRPTAGTHQASTSSIPSSSSWRTQRSSSLMSDLEHEEFMSLVANRLLDRTYTSTTCLSSDGASSISSDRPLPPPEPPQVLTPPPPPDQDWGSSAPYKPFLAHAPAPQDSYIAVDTKPHEYRLIVRLPGFRRDAITVSTRKRRILHVVADSWEPDGGHFEQRISFGYDALLAQVRAEFDGEHLQVIVPRRTFPTTSLPARE